MSLCEFEKTSDTPDDNGRDTYTCTVCKRSITTRSLPITRTCRLESDKPKQGGPGTEFRKLAAQIGVKRKADCKCDALERRMDFFGVEGCRDRREELLAALRESYTAYGLADKLRAAVNAVASGLAFEIDPRDPVASLFELAIERASSRPVV
jgi:hypothetical protein